MKRNMDLIRKILLTIEEEHDGRNRVQIHSVEGYPRNEVSFHVHLLVDAGYVNAGKVGALQGTVYLIRGITWEGYEFLDAVRSDNVWSRVQKKLKVIGGQASVATVRQLAIEITKGLL